MEAMEAIKSPDFTTRESDILHLISHAYTRKQIATTLRISYSTVDSHLYSIFKKTEVHGHVELILYAQRNGFGVKQSSRITESLSPSLLINAQKPESIKIVAET